MRNRSSSFISVVLCALVVSGCFTPEEDAFEATRENEDSCVELEAACSVNGDCCDFATATEVGTALCVNDGTEAACADVCTANDDCGSGCCGQLDHQAGYGACMDSSVCDAGYGYGSADACLRGVDVFCGCGTQLDVPCEDEAGYRDSCADSSSSGVNDIFTCFAAFDTTQCGAALDACG